MGDQMRHHSEGPIDLAEILLNDIGAVCGCVKGRSDILTAATVGTGGGSPNNHFQIHSIGPLDFALGTLNDLNDDAEVIDDDDGRPVIPRPLKRQNSEVKMSASETLLDDVAGDNLDGSPSATINFQHLTKSTL